jgi:hypothetical protein
MRMFPNDLQAWLEHGEFETMHGEGFSRGNPNLCDRLKVEELVLDVPRDAEESERPRYGYAQGSQEDGRQINHLGQVLVRFHDHIRALSNVLLGDSMGSTNIAEFACIGPAPLHEPQLICRFSSVDVLGASGLAEACDPAFPYAEVQIYGSLRAESIKQVLFCNDLAIPVELSRLLNRLDVAHERIAGYQP